MYSNAVILEIFSFFVIKFASLNNNTKFRKLKIIFKKTCDSIKHKSEFTFVKFYMLWLKIFNIAENPGKKACIDS